MKITAEIPNPETFDEVYDAWVKDHPSEKYPFDKQIYSSMDWVDLGWCVDASKLRELLK